MAGVQLDAVALLKADHRKVENLFAKFQSARKPKKHGLAQQICTELTVHTIIEEEIFYPACKGEIEADMLGEAYVEHDGAKVLIAEIEASSPDAEFYNAKVKVLSEQIKHHVREEERRSEGMFASARAAGVNMENLGARMQARKRELLAQFQADGLPIPETRSFTGHKLKTGAPIVKSTEKA
jgi:hypothetical protein